MEKTRVQNFEKIIRDICFKVKVEGRKIIKNSDISPAQFDLLQILYFRGPKRVTDISLILGITKSTTTGLINRLEASGYLEKVKDKRDKRVTTITITEKGKNVIDEVIKARVEFMQKVLDKMKKPEEVMDRLECLDKMINEVRENEKE
ncbi:MarR family transcriptional regulator [Marinitoga sp. 1135]|uniref:Transcriptional regulator n=1 Tax=Marinitoga piezophila (strain DSM 14283 / JCM 11233 / KA3) TaxID=443254 RepID=H2J366_MARPK|nr:MULTISPECIES: MarR family transcriptional regulator [Marinitoga]AEX84584.1 transcriptional regulator [Marinitoga piezophila KA3]APT75104.1 MarR family transcriptional regulator [Marinitoga sp. 1137]NUU94877.1 MarR family transcriptional regulator [Marinitoga sp. 1135]NUU96815.1 MarR family transcriptional regulator [Marinitoga sp. 1138]